MFNEDEDWNDEEEVPSKTVVKANLKSNSGKQVKVSIFLFKRFRVYGSMSVVPLYTCY